MSEGANLESLDALRHFRIALIKFMESAGVAMADAESEMGDVLNWLEHEQTTHWQSQIRKRHDEVERAKESLRMKRRFRDASGRMPTAIEEEKAVAKARARIEEAENKLISVKKNIRVLTREIQTYRGLSQRLATTIAADLPTATAMLNDFLAMLEQYTQLAPPEQQGRQEH